MKRATARQKRRYWMESADGSVGISTAPMRCAVSYKASLMRQPPYLRAQLQNLNGTIVPVMDPADNHVADLSVMPMRPEVAAVILKLDEYVLPALPFGIYAPLAFTVRVISANGLDQETQLPTNHPKEINDTLFIDGRKAQSPEVKRFTELHLLSALRHHFPSSRIWGMC